MNRHKNRWVNLGSFMTILILLAPSAAHAGDAQQALQWLVNQQKSDGAWHGADSSLEIRDTSEVTAALSLQLSAVSQQQNPSIQAAVAKGASYMLNVVAPDADALIRKAVVGRKTGYVRSDDVLGFKALRNADGGYAFFTGYDNTEINDFIKWG